MADQQKITKYEDDCSSRAGYSFLPFACDVTGIITHTASAVLDRIASAYVTHKDTLFGFALDILRRRMSYSFQLGVARQLIHLFHSRTEAR
jgi:hypothetical protein